MTYIYKVDLFYIYEIGTFLFFNGGGGVVFYSDIQTFVISLYRGKDWGWKWGEVYPDLNYEKKIVCFLSESF